MRLYLPEIPVSRTRVLAADCGWFPGEPLGLLSIRVLSFTQTPGQFVIFALQIAHLGLEIIILSK